MIPQETINELLEQTNIVDFIGQYVQLTKRGKNYLGLCPYHEEKTPSFSVNEEKQLFHCFSCQRGGTVFSFLQYLENLSFPDAVIEVAKKTNFALPDSVTNAPSQDSPTFALRKMYAATKDFFAHILVNTKTGENALKYLEERQLSDAIVEQFEIGYAPNNRDVLLKYLQQQNYSNEQLLESGLFVQSKTGELFDRFRDRVMFPVKNATGQTVGFSGRKLSATNDEPKYLNSPETKLFNKSELLFNLDQAKTHLKDEQHLILFEGFMDVISAYQAGVQSGIASMGTSLTDEQIYLIRRLTNKVLINYDGDEPGQKATIRAINLFQKKAPQVQLGIISLPNQMDPDEFIKANGALKYQAEVNGAVTDLQFELDMLEKKYNLNNDREKIAYSKDALMAIAKLDSQSARDVYLNKVAQQTGISLAALNADLLGATRKIKQVARNTQNLYPDKEVLPRPENTPALTITSKSDRAQARLLYLALHYAEVDLRLIAEEFVFPNENFEKIFDLWHNYKSTHEDIIITAFLDTLPNELQSIVITLEMIDQPTNYVDEEIFDAIQVISENFQTDQLQLLNNDLVDARRKNDQELIREITSKIIKIRRLLDK